MKRYAQKKREEETEVRDLSKCGYSTTAGGKKVRLGSGESRGKFYKAKTVLFGTERKG